LRRADERCLEKSIWIDFKRDVKKLNHVHIGILRHTKSAFYWEIVHSQQMIHNEEG